MRMKGEIMPKILIVFHGGSGALAMLASDAAAGAEGVRFAETKVRSTLPDAEELLMHDGVLFGFEGPENDAAWGEMAAGMGQLADWARENPGRFSNVVGGVFSSTDAGERAGIAALSRLGAIVVTTGDRAGDSRGRARALGVRVAKTAEWVRHGLSHERGHAHTHQKTTD
jgi:hypothetical protein